MNSLPAPWKESNDKPRQHIKKQRYYFAYKGPYSQSYGFFQQSEVRAGYEMNGYESRTIKRLSTEELMPSNCGAGEVS